MALTKQAEAGRTSNVTPPTRYTAVTATTTVTRLADENLSRTELILTNTSTAILYISFVRLPSTTDYTVAIPAGGTFVTSSANRVYGVWASAGGGQVNITEEY